MQQFLIGDLEAQANTILDTASCEPVALVCDNKSRFVLLSYEHYECLSSSPNPRRSCRTNVLSEQHFPLFEDALARLAKGEDSIY